MRLCSCLIPKIHALAGQFLSPAVNLENEVLLIKSNTFGTPHFYFVDPHPTTLSPTTHVFLKKTFKSYRKYIYIFGVSFFCKVF